MKTKIIDLTKEESELVIQDLAKKVILLEEALEEANTSLFSKGMFGVIPCNSVSFLESSKFYGKVRQLIKKKNPMAHTGKICKQ